MPNASVNGWVDEAISSLTTELVPLVLVADGSLFAHEVRDHLLALSGKESARGIVCAEPAEGLPAIVSVFDAAFRQSLHPLRLWDGQLPWLVVVADLGTTGDVTELAKMVANAMGDPLRAPGLVLLALKGELNEAGWASVCKTCTATGSNVVLFLLSEKGALATRGPKLLAKGVASYVCVGWQRYSRERNGNWREALGLAGRERVFTLGIGHDAPDWVFHGRNWSRALTHHLAQQWCALGRQPQTPEFPKPIELTAECIPPSNYEVQEDPKARGPSLVLKQRASRLCFLEPPALPAYRARLNTMDMPTRIEGLRSFQQFLELLERPVANRVTATRCLRWVEQMRNELLAGLRLPQNPGGSFAWMRQVMEHWRGFLAVPAEARTIPAAGSRGFEANLAILRKKASRVPSISSALLRFGLLVTASFWTVFGTFFWVNRGSPFTNPTMRLVSVGSIVALIAVLTGTFVQYAFTLHACGRAEDLTRRDLLSEHLAALLATMRAELELRAGALRSEVCAWIEALARLRDDLEKYGGQPGANSANPLDNQSPRFAHDRMDSLLQAELPQLLDLAHGRVRKILESSPDWPCWELARWLKSAGEATASVVAEYTAGLNYDDCVEAANLEGLARSLILADVVADARNPAFLAHSATNTRVILLASDAWASYIGQHDDVTLTGHRLNYMIGVAAIPLRLPGLDCEE